MLSSLRTGTRMPRKRLGDPPPSPGQGQRGQVTDMWSWQQECTHQAGFQLPPGPPVTAGWLPVSSWGCCLGRCASAPPSCCGTQPQRTLQRGAQDRELTTPRTQSPGRPCGWSDRQPARAEMLLLAMILFDAFRGARAHTETGMMPTFILREHQPHEATPLTSTLGRTKTKAQLQVSTPHPRFKKT